MAGIDSFKKFGEVNDLTAFEYVSDNRFLDLYTKGNGLIFITKPLLFLYPEDANGELQQLAYSNMCQDPVFTPFTTKNSTNLDGIILRQLSYFNNLRYNNFKMGK